MRRTVVGVVAEVRHAYDDGDARDVYVPYLQSGPNRYASFYLRAPLPLAALAREVRAATAEVDPRAIVRDVLTVDGGVGLVGGGSLPGVDVDLSRGGELAPALVALAALASGPSTLTGIGHLRGHETDRLAALASEISAPSPMPIRAGGRSGQGKKVRSVPGCPSASA